MVGISCKNASPEAERPRERPGRNGGPMKRGRRHGRLPHSRARAVAGGSNVGRCPIYRKNPALLWGERPYRRPRFIGPPFLPLRPRGRSASGDAFSQEIPTTGEDFRRPRPPPPKSIMSPVLPNTPFQKSKERMLGFWGVHQAE